ncbi:hypothetical protein [Pseudomonas sp. AP-1]|uniref:dioxygenase family protein n=1 Tax=Pseudomonas sp. AP-1 TaxID=3231718 RepID=UPI0035AEDC5D
MPPPTVKAGEESLLYDVFLEAKATDIGNDGRQGSPQGIEGPFYFPGAPKLTPPYVLPQRPDERGDALYFFGRVTNTDGEPIAGAELDFWQADAQGLYSNVAPTVPDWNLRGRIETDEQGLYEVKTIVPPPYEIPKNGPTGVLLTALGAPHFFRPAHMHIMVRHPDYQDLITQLYFRGGEYTDSDIGHAVRDDLFTTLTARTSAGDSTYEAQYDFALKAKF